MKSLGIKVQSIVNPHRAAVVDSTMRFAIGHDIFYFSNQRERESFVRDPLEYSRRLTDPVTLRRFEPRRTSPRLEYHGRAYYFSSDSTLAMFRAAPDSFAVRKGM
jgi:YHS domain-containing protein